MDTKKLLIALAASVAVNCFFIGFETARLTRPCPRAERQAFPERRHMPIERDFQKHAQKGGLEKFFKKNKDVMRQYRKQFEKSGKEIGEAIRAKDFSEERLRAALKNASETRAQIDAKMQEMLLETVKAMNPQERVEFAKQMDKKHREKDGKRKKFEPRRFDERRLPPPPAFDAPAMPPEMKPEFEAREPVREVESDYDLYDLPPQKKPEFVTLPMPQPSRPVVVDTPAEEPAFVTLPMPQPSRPVVVEAVVIEEATPVDESAPNVLPEEPRPEPVALFDEPRPAPVAMPEPEQAENVSQARKKRKEAHDRVIQYNKARRKQTGRQIPEKAE